MSEADDKHLWEVDHPYYCSESNYYSNEPFSQWDMWSSFEAEFCDADLDMNMIFRWDWREGEGYGGEYTGDNYYRNGVLQVFFIMQRKGIFACHEISVCRADEPAVKAFLAPRWEYMKTLWKPLSDS